MKINKTRYTYTNTHAHHTRDEQAAKAHQGEARQADRMLQDSAAGIRGGAGGERAQGGGAQADLPVRVEQSQCIHSGGQAKHGWRRRRSRAEGSSMAGHAHGERRRRSKRSLLHAPAQEETDEEESSPLEKTNNYDNRRRSSCNRKLHIHLYIVDLVRTFLYDLGYCSS